MRTSLALTITLVLALVFHCYPQSRETGAILGTVTDARTEPLPGVSVTLSGGSLMGRRTAISDPEGFFRFPALPPGRYDVTAELAGFRTAVQKGLRLTTTVILTVAMVLAPLAVAEEVTVVAEAPTVDVKSAETASVTLSEEILRNIPYNQYSGNIVNLAPGVEGDVAYGASQLSGIASTMDGVNVSDPMVGGQWVIVDHNIVAEAKIMGVGLPAEYGGFSGVIFNLVTKSGGNAFSGHFEFDYQGQDTDWPKGLWQASNIGAYSQEFPGLTAPHERSLDGSAHLGGPLRADRLWFYAGLQWNQAWRRTTGFPLPAASIQPRAFAKLTAQLGRSLNLMAWLETDILDMDDLGGSALTSPEATVRMRSFEVVGNFSLTKVLDPRAFFDLKGSFFSGSWSMEPMAGADAVCRIEIADGDYKTGSSGYGWRQDPDRLQFNASVSRYSEDFLAGDHDFKFGAEIERSANKLHFEYTGADHTVYRDYQGLPYLAYRYEGYTTDTRYTRLEVFAQDAWQVTKRLNVNAGLRYSRNRGTVKGVPGIVYRTARLAPRLGFTLDLLGDRTTVLKAHYGHFTEAMMTAIHERMNPDTAYNDFIASYWSGTEWIEFDRLVHEGLFRMDPAIKHPYLEQWTLGLERELFRDASLSVTYIHRDWRKLISFYDTESAYERAPFDVPELGTTLDLYERTSGGSHDFVLTNIAPPDPWIPAEYGRRYRGLEVLFNKRFSRRWQVLASYVRARARGTVDNGTSSDIGWGSHDSLTPGDPNYWINADGDSTYVPTHMVKLQGTYIVPGLELAINAYFRAVSGHAWTTRFTSPLLAQGRVTVFAEPRGSGRYPMDRTLDVRLEKVFTIGAKYRLGLIADVFNVFNADTVLDWGTVLGRDYDPAMAGDSLTGGHALYAITTPRRARLGVRLMF
jgi:outer membrane receptor protein involved in Fe transport